MSKLMKKVLVQKGCAGFITEITSQYFLSSNKPGITYFEGLEGIKKNL